MLTLSLLGAVAFPLLVLLLTVFLTLFSAQFILHGRMVLSIHTCMHSTLDSVTEIRRISQKTHTVVGPLQNLSSEHGSAEIVKPCLQKV